LYAALKGDFEIPQCAGTSLEDCLHSGQKDPLAQRLSSFACWLAFLDKDSASIADKLDQRYESLASEKRYSIDLPLFEPAGDSLAPVAIVAYISIGCPWCKVVCNFLHDSVTVGSLNGKARLFVKLLSVTHRDMALLAADENDNFWEYMKLLGTIEQRLDEDVLLDAAKKQGIPLWQFKAAMQNQALRERAMASRKEAVGFGVKSTPTLFINGRWYRSYKNPKWLVDAVEYEYEKCAESSNPN